MKLNYDLYIGSNPNPKDTNNIVVKGQLEGGRLVNVESMKLGDRELVNRGGEKTVISIAVDAPDEFIGTPEETAAHLNCSVDDLVSIFSADAVNLEYAGASFYLPLTARADFTGGYYECVFGNVTVGEVGIDMHISVNTDSNGNYYFKLGDYWS